MLMLLHLDRINVIIVLLTLSREIIIITLRAVAASENIVIQASSGGKGKATLQNFGVAALFLYGYEYAGISTSLVGNILLILSIIISWYSMAIYFKSYIKLSNKT